MFELLNEYGFVFTGYCKPCGGSKAIYKHPEKQGIEIKIDKKGYGFTLYGPDNRGTIRQRDFGGLEKLKTIIGTI